jgi:hypothetical protein
VRDLVARILSESRSGGIEDCSCDGRCVVSVHLGTALAGNSSSATRKPTDWWRKRRPESLEQPENSPYTTAHDWCNESMTWDAPLQWLVEWLDESWEQLRVGGQPPVLLLGADAAPGECLGVSSLPKELLRFRPCTVAQIMGDRDSPLWTTAREVVGDMLTDEALLTVVEWAVQAAADVLVTSNSTLSFSAAWIASMSASTASGTPGRSTLPRTCNWSVVGSGTSDALLKAATALSRRGGSWSSRATTRRVAVAYWSRRGGSGGGGRRRLELAL